jgi:hypothetical protein
MFGRRLASWNRFWFAPADPTVLGLIRICCGAVTTYTLFAYSFMLPDLLGKDAWYDLDLRLNTVRYRPSLTSPLHAPVGMEYAPAVASTPKEQEYIDAYKKKWGVAPPPPFPRDAEEAKQLDEFKEDHVYDLRVFGLAPPRTPQEYAYLDEYMHHSANVLRRPPPAYPHSDREKQDVFAYMAENDGFDPRLAASIGVPAWSLWFHVTDPRTMLFIHILIVLVAFLFTIGFCTRITSALTWMTSLWYIHRDPVMLFGVDTMMTILLLYLMIGSSGAALSVDRLIARWWSTAKPRVVNRWRRLFWRPALPQGALQPAAYSPVPLPTVSANFAIRLLQIHLCFVYGVSGLSKLQGPAWWQGTAVWGTLANYEFAPMNFEIFGVQVYTEFLRWLGHDWFLLACLLTASSWFTLAFEIGYPFLIWRPSTRWLFLWPSSYTASSACSWVSKPSRS